MIAPLRFDTFCFADHCIYHGTGSSAPRVNSNRFGRDSQNGLNSKRYINTPSITIEGESVVNCYTESTLSTDTNTMQYIYSALKSMKKRGAEIVQRIYNHTNNNNINLIKLNRNESVNWLIVAILRRDEVCNVTYLSTCTYFEMSLSVHEPLIVASSSIKYTFPSSLTLKFGEYISCHHRSYSPHSQQSATPN